MHLRAVCMCEMCVSVPAGQFVHSSRVIYMQYADLSYSKHACMVRMHCLVMAACMPWQNYLHITKLINSRLIMTDKRTTTTTQPPPWTDCGSEDLAVRNYTDMHQVYVVKDVMLFCIYTIVA